jgi:hypothetical protein
MQKLGWYLTQPMISLTERNGRDLNEAAATALAAVLGVGLSELGGRYLTPRDVQLVRKAADDLHALMKESV